MGTPNPPWQWWVGQYFSYDFSHGVGQSAQALTRCDAKQGFAAAHLGGSGTHLGGIWVACRRYWGIFGKSWLTYLMIRCIKNVGLVIWGMKG